ncbi:hypothetical protein HKX48_002658 [Thoreauomyces humboldtii]|nr:hypothetical protein HKX48_002658 [Thoreauomyces humboldtii]
MFGAPKPAFSFGAPATTTQAAPGGFGAPAPAGGSLFGAAAPASQPAAGGFSFGAPAASAAPSFGFGAAAAPAGSAPAGGLFGAPAASGTSLFGAPAPAASQPGAAPFSFGAPAASAPAAAPSLFGAPAASSAAPGFSLFGAAPTASSAPQPSLFGAPAAASSAPGASLFGAAAAPGPSVFGAPAAAPTAAAGQAAFTFKTKYSDIPADSRKQVDEIELFIQQQIRTAESVAGNNSGDCIDEISGDVKSLAQKVAGLHNMLSRDIFLINRTNSHHTPTPQKHDPYMAYFQNYADTVDQRMQQYRQTIEELEASIRNLAEERQYSPVVLVEIMRDQDDSILAVAGKIAAVHDAVLKQQAQYQEFRRKYFGEDVADGGRRRGEWNPQGREETSLELIASTTLRPAGQPQAAPGQQPAGGAFGQSVGGFGQQPAAGFGASAFGASTGFGQPAAAPSLFGDANSRKIKRPTLQIS